MPEFIPGLELARGFYDDVVRPLIDRPHTACLIGEGSEVLGYDTERSTDHEWGPRLQLFTAAEDVSRIAELIKEGLPRQYRGHATSWFSLVQGGDSHHLEISTLDDWLTRRLPTIPRSTPDPAAWLAIPQQHLLQLTAGEMFRDDDGRLGRLREDYRWYPIDVWRWIVASQWHLIGNTTPLLGRTVELGDLRGARLIMGTLCRLIMELAFLQERRYRPYAKWFGRAFDELAAAASLGPLIDCALAEPPTGRTDDPVYEALLELGRRHDGLALSEPVEPAIELFDVGVNGAVRPYPVLNAAAFINATFEAITDPALRNLPRVGAIDQLTHADDQLINFTGWPADLGAVFSAQLRALAQEARQ